MFHIAGSEKGAVVYVVVAHATMIEWMMKSLGHPVQKSEYCAINILEDELWEDDQCRIVHQRQFLEKNLLGYKEKKFYDRAPVVEERGIIGGFFNSMFCGKC